MKSNGSMNRVFRVIWNASKSLWQAVSETGKAQGKEKSSRRLRRSAGLGLVAVAGAAFAAPAPNELPSGGTVIAGAASITSNNARMDVLQSTQRAAIDWQSFNIGSAAQVHFEQPSGGVALNRVLDTNASQIYGKLSSTGQVFLINPNGVLFAPGAQVDTGGIVASTLPIKLEDFMAGNYSFQGNSSNAVINQGNIRVGTGGSVALIAARIANTGSIEAPEGNVLLGAGRDVTLDLGGPVKIQVKQGALDALIEQGGAIKADGGVVYLTAKAANELTTTVINHTGVTEARTLATGKKGEIVLMGGFEHERIVVGGTLDASAPAGGDGGFIETSAAHVQIDPQVAVTTLSSFGKTGTWLIDPTDFTISAGSAAQSDSGIGATTLSTALNSNNVTIQTVAAGGGNGDITVDAAVTKTSGTATTLTLAAHRDISVNAAISGANGSPLNVVLASRATGGATGGVYVGANIRSYGGNITIGGGDVNASDYAITSLSAPYYPNTAGIFIGQAIIDATSDGSGSANNTLPTAAGGGNIVMRGKGDVNTAHQFNAGVYFYKDQTIGVVTGGTGSITIEGYGGKAAGHFWDVGAAGVLWESSTTYIKANQGDVRIKGYAGTVADRYGIALDNTFIGTNGYLGIEGDSLAQRGGTLRLNVGGSGDITAPLLGLSAGGYTLAKSGSGVLNLSGNAAAWSAARAGLGNTADTRTVGTFTDANGMVNLVNLTASQALYAFATRPTTTTVSRSSATPLSGGGGGDAPSSTNPDAQSAAVATAQSAAAATTTAVFQTPTALPPSFVPTRAGALPVTNISGGLAFVQLPSQSGGGASATYVSVPSEAAPNAPGAADTAAGGGQGTGNAGSASAGVPEDGGGRDPMGFMRVFVVGGGVNLPVAAPDAPGRGSAF